MGFLDRNKFPARCVVHCPAGTLNYSQPSSDLIGSKLHTITCYSEDSRHVLSPQIIFCSPFASPAMQEGLLRPSPSFQVLSLAWQEKTTQKVNVNPTIHALEATNGENRKPDPSRILLLGWPFVLAESTLHFVSIICRTVSTRT